jgi:hypothetical protein
MGQLGTSSGNSNGLRNFRMGLIPGNQGSPVVVVIATDDLREQANYVAALTNNVPGGTVVWVGVFSASAATSVRSFAGPAQYRSVDVGRYQYVINSGGHPYVIRLNVNPTINNYLIPPTGNLRLLP